MSAVLNVLRSPYVSAHKCTGERKTTDGQPMVYDNLRGGLTHVSNTLFDLFVAIEMELRKHLHTENVSETTRVKTIAVERIVNNEDAQLHWAIISVNWVEYKMLLLIDEIRPVL